MSVGTSPITSNFTGPQIRPLDYLSLITHESTHAELARTIEDLTKWLSVVEIGLSGMLETTHTDTIEEEQEVNSDIEDEHATPLHPGGSIGAEDRRLLSK
jgi:protein-serine/threonine kinase